MKIQLVFILILAKFLHTLIDLFRHVLLVGGRDSPQDLHSLLLLSLGYEPPAGLREEEGNDKDCDHLRENGPVKGLPVGEILGQPGLVGPTKSEGEGQTNVAHQSPLVYRHVLQH